MGVLEGFYSGVRYNLARSIFWLSCSRGSPDVNITHTTLHFTSSVVRVLPPALTYHLCEAWWQSLWWGWGVSGRLLQCSVAWQRKARRQQSPFSVVDTYLYKTDRCWTQGHAPTLWRKEDKLYGYDSVYRWRDKSPSSYFYSYTYSNILLNTFFNNLTELLLSQVVISTFLRISCDHPECLGSWCVGGVTVE